MFFLLNNLTIRNHRATALTADIACVALFRTSSLPGVTNLSLTDMMVRIGSNRFRLRLAAFRTGISLQTGIHTACRAGDNALVPAVLVLNELRIQRNVIIGRIEIGIPVFVGPPGKVVTQAGDGLRGSQFSADPVVRHHITVIILPGHCYKNRCPLENVGRIIGIEYRAAVYSSPLGLICLYLRQIRFVDSEITVSIPRIRQISADLFRQVLQHLPALQGSFFRCKLGIAMIPCIIQNPVRLIRMLSKIRIQCHSACRRFRRTADIFVAVFVRPAVEIITGTGGGPGLRHCPADPVIRHDITIVVFPGNIHHNR